jgi:hypothetical protein
MMHATPLGQLVAAQALAVPNACADLYELTSEDRSEIEELWRVCRKFEPTIARTADRLAEALRQHGYNTEPGIRDCVDKCLKAAFEFLCFPFDPEKDMVWKVVRMAVADKMPNYMPGCPVDIKHEALRDSIRSRQHILSSDYSPGKQLLVNFAPKGSSFSSLMLPRITRPQEAREPSHIFFFEGGTTKGEMEVLQPTESSLPFSPPEIYTQTYALAFEPGIQATFSLQEKNRMFYMPEVGRFLSRDMILRPTANPYAYAENNPARYTDPTGLWDEAGHFYTTYIIAKAAGMSNAQAFELAYYSQLPDEVPTYDAAHAGTQLIVNEAFRVAGAGLSPTDISFYNDIQQLLHSLHSGDVNTRRKCLQDLFKAGGLQPWEQCRRPN